MRVAISSFIIFVCDFWITHKKITFFSFFISF